MPRKLQINHGMQVAVIDLEFAGAGRITHMLKLVAFDLDGVIYRGAQILPHALDAVFAIEERRLLLRYVTNNATMHRTTLAQQLQSMGIPVKDEQVLGSAAATATWLQGRFAAGSQVLALGESGLLEELREVGFAAQHVLDASGDAAPVAVVVGLDRALTYKSLAAAQHFIMQGALFVATNTDATFPAEGRLLPGGGSVVAAVAAASGVDPVVIGKPGLGMAEVLRSTTGVDYPEILFVGDRLDTDIAMGVRAGMKTLLVLTGVHTRKHLACSEVQPDFILDDLAELPLLLDKAMQD